MCGPKYRGIIFFSLSNIRALNYYVCFSEAFIHYFNLEQMVHYQGQYILIDRTAERISVLVVRNF